MSRLATWIGRYADAAVVIVLAVVSGALGLADIMGINNVSAAILTVLALLALSLLRDRARMESGEKRTAGFIERATRTLGEMPGAASLAQWREGVASMRTELAHAR